MLTIWMCGFLLTSGATLVQTRPEEGSSRSAPMWQNAAITRSCILGEKISLSLTPGRSVILRCGENPAGLSEVLLSYEAERLYHGYRFRDGTKTLAFLIRGQPADRTMSMDTDKTAPWVESRIEWTPDADKAAVSITVALVPDERRQRMIRDSQERMAKRREEELRRVRRVLEWDRQEQVQPIRIIMDDPAGPELTRLRSHYELDKIVAGTADEYEKLRRLVKWSHDRWQHHSDNNPSKPDPLTILQEAAQGKRFRCVEYATVIAGCTRCLGMPSRQLGLKREDVETAKSGAGHVVAEVWLDQFKKWVFVDGQWDAIPEKQGVPLNAVEFQDSIAHDDPGLIIRSSSGVKKDEYIAWVGAYLHYFDFTLDQRMFRADIKHGEAERRAPSSGQIMLVPKGAPRPRVFQRNSSIGRCVYISNPEAFYSALISTLSATAPAGGTTLPSPAVSPDLMIRPGEGVGDLKFGMSVEQMHKILGKPDRSQAKSHEYLSRGMAVTGSGDVGVAVLLFGGRCDKDQPLVGKCRYRTTRDIGMGSSEEEVVAAYGPPSSRQEASQGDEDSVVLSYDKLRATFVLRGGQVVHMTFKPPAR